MKLEYAIYGLGGVALINGFRHLYIKNRTGKSKNTRFDTLLIIAYISIFIFAIYNAGLTVIGAIKDYF